MPDSMSSIPDSPDVLELARENGKVHWLDLATGRQFATADPTSPSFQTVVGDDARREAELLAPVLDVFGRHGYAVNRSTNTLYVFVTCGATTYHVGFLADADSEIVCGCTFPPDPVPAHRRAAVAEAMSRINARLCSGNFELDHQSGHMRFRISIFLGASQLTQKMADYLVHEGPYQWERYAGALARVIHDGVAPAVAIPSRAA